MIKAIIFDCFGVLVTDTLVAFREAHFGHDPAKIQQVIDATRAVDLGMMTRREFMQLMGEMSGVAFSDVFELLENGSVLDHRMLEKIKILKSSYKIGMLSNVPRSRLDKFFTADDMALFDALSLSYETGFVKPEPQAYQIAADRLNVLPEECIFVDDQERNITGAQEAGMKALHYKNFVQFEKELEKLLQ